MTPVIPSPKYQTEVYLEYRSVDRFLFRASDLSALNDLLSDESRYRVDQCHIYLIAKRPRLSIVPGSLKRRGSELRLQVEFRHDGKPQRQAVVLPADVLAEPGETLEIAPYPHRELLTKAADGKLMGTTLLANLAHVLGLPPVASDLEVVYIGKGLRDSARDRLRAHSTLQEILAKAGSDDPDAEVFLIVHAFAPTKPALKFPDDMTPEITGPQARERLERAIRVKLAKTDQVALIEAACIAYFQTSRYNSHYLNFPDKETDALRKIRPGDYAAICVQLDHTNIGDLSVFSRTAPSQVTHDIVVDFRHREGRWSPVAESRSAAQANQIAGPERIGHGRMSPLAAFRSALASRLSRWRGT